MNSKKIKDLSLLLTLTHSERSTILNVIRRKLTYLSIGRLKKIVRVCKQIKKVGMDGMIIEAGCALGGSSILISKFKPKDTPLHVYDVFGMIPEPTTKDSQAEHKRYEKIKSGKSEGIRGDTYYGYENDLYKKVVNNFISSNVNLDENNVHLIQGLLQDTMKLEDPVAFAHIDVDWFDPVYTSLERIFPRLVSKGCIILDDYFDWESCRRATDQYLETVPGQYQLDSQYGSLKITKI